jgi:cell division septation protein DedD
VRLKPPLIKAEPGPTKIVPEQPGGLEIPNQDKQVFDRIAKEKTGPKVERLLPPPEAPKEIPAPTPATEELPEAAMPKQSPQAGGGEQAPLDPEMTEPGAPMAVEVEPAPAPEAEPEHEEKMAKASPPPVEASSPGGTDVMAGYRVQLGAFREPGQAMDAWKIIAGKNKDLIAGLDPLVVRVDLGKGKGIYHRLQAGPVADKATADALCGKLKARKQGCLPVSPK